MNYFEFDVSKSTNTAVHSDEKGVIYSYVCQRGRTQYMQRRLDVLSFILVV